MEGDAPAEVRAAWVEVLTTALALCLVAFVLYTALRGEFSADIQRGIPFAGIAIIILARHPVVAGARWLRLIDVLLALGALYAIGYILIHGEAMVTRLGRVLPTDVTACVIGIVVLFEIARRTIGLVLPAIALLFMVYAVLGAYLPEPLAHRGLSIGRIALAGWAGSDGAFGIAFGVMVGVVYIYMILASLMKRTGAANALLQIARRLTGRARSGPGLTTVVSSGLFGMASGSGVADVAAIGTANIPAMKRAGYTAEFAASVQALAAIGAQIMPPIMGSSAFIIAELTSTSYARIAMMAAIPALLYYSCVAAAVHFHACRFGLNASQESATRLDRLETAIAVVPLATLIALLVLGQSAARAALWAMLVLLLLSLWNPMTRIRPRTLLTVVREGTINSLPLWTATATIGLIISAVSLTGAATQISMAVVEISKNSLFLALCVTMLASIVLGTALPTIAAYLLLVIMVAPALHGLGVPLVIAHLFVFFYGVTSDLTPPTALAPLTASAIAGANFWRTCWLTMRIGLPIFVIPFAFVYNPALVLVGSWSDIVVSALLAVTGVVFFTAGTVGYLRDALGATARIAVLAGGIAMLWPTITVALGGLAACAAVLAWQSLQGRRTA